ncbi:hypothetical protein ABB02_00878 [Clostridiaceae bacterium JG1575]|nr:hypothetical protein ABB02_00878 [Clostridiaceae bacterium JG1575]
MSLRVQEILPEDPPVHSLERSFAGSIKELWQWITDPERTSLWIGSYEMGPENTLWLTPRTPMGLSRIPMTLLEINEGTGLTLSIDGPSGPWLLLVCLEEVGDHASRLTLLSPLTDSNDAAPLESFFCAPLEALSTAFSKAKDTP